MSELRSDVLGVRSLCLQDERGDNSEHTQYAGARLWDGLLPLEEDQFPSSGSDCRFLKQCTLCPYSTDRSSNLKDHMRRHLGDKPYSCPYCSYRCSHKPHLKVHLRVHTREKPYTCPYCPYSAAQSSSVKSHIASTHGTQPSTHDTQPSAPDTQPSSHDTQPSLHDTQPSTHDTQPSTHDTRAAES